MSASQDAIDRAPNGPGEAARLDRLWLAEARAEDRVLDVFAGEQAGARYSEQEWAEARHAAEAAEQARETAFPDVGYHPLNAGWRASAERTEPVAAVAAVTEPACLAPAEDGLGEDPVRHWSGEPAAAGRADESGWGV